MNISLDFKPGATSGEIKLAVDSLDRQIKEAFPRVKKVFVEAEAWKRGLMPGRRRGGQGLRGNGPAKSGEETGRKRSPNN